MGTHEPAATLGAGQSSQRREAGPPAIKGESTWQKAITAPATSWKRKCARKVWASLKTRWLQRLAGDGDARRGAAGEHDDAVLLDHPPGRGAGGVGLGLGVAGDVGELLAEDAVDRKSVV